MENGLTKKLSKKCSKKARKPGTKCLRAPPSQGLMISQRWWWWGIPRGSPAYAKEPYQSYAALASDTGAGMEVHDSVPAPGIPKMTEDWRWPWQWHWHGHGKAMAWPRPWPWPWPWHAHGMPMAIAMPWIAMALPWPGHGMAMVMASPWPWLLTPSLATDRNMGCMAVAWRERTRSSAPKAS